MVFAIECVIAIVVFTITVVTIARTTNPTSWMFNYPQPIVDRCFELGLIPTNKNVRSASVYARKTVAGIIIGIILGFIVKYVNGADTFIRGFLTAYALWLVVDWFDVLIDIFWFCQDKRMIIPGTEDLTDSYHDYMFHVRASARGMLLGIIPSIAAGVVAAL